jgi:hypothetical protein
MACSNDTSKDTKMAGMNANAPTKGSGGSQKKKGKQWKKLDLATGQTIREKPKYRYVS